MEKRIPRGSSDTVDVETFFSGIGQWSNGSKFGVTSTVVDGLVNRPHFNDSKMTYEEWLVHTRLSRLLMTVRDLQSMMLVCQRTMLSFELHSGAKS